MEKVKKIVVTTVIAMLVLGTGLSLFSSSSSLVSQNQSNQNKVDQINGLKIEDITIGTGDEAKSGMRVTAHYLGTLTDGTKFDSSYDRGEPFSFILGAGQVIAGWDKGIEGMRVGGKRRLTVSPEMGYGPQAVDTIPANSTLVFEVELLGASAQ